MGLFFRLALAVSCTSVFACALVTDLGSLAGDAGEGGVACDAAGACTTFALPATWTPIAYHEGFVGCPSGFVSEKYVTDPVATCTCGCTVSSPPVCDVGKTKTYYGSSCGTAGAVLTVDGGGCTPISGQLQSTFQAEPVAPTGITCAASGAPDASTTSAEACIPQQCGDTICQGIVPPGYKACVVADGDVPCPPSTPFTSKKSVGTSTTVTCAPGCLCVVQGTCSNAKLTFYTDSQCAHALVTLPADNTCTQTNQNGAQIGAFEYQATPSSACSVSGSSAADASLVGIRTICCAP